MPELAKPSALSRNFVLVHGAWHGGWCWRRVADLLTARGHRVFTPTLSGLGERSHLLSAAVNLDTHIADIVNVDQMGGVGEGRAVRPFLWRNHHLRRRRRGFSGDLLARLSRCFRAGGWQVLGRCHGAGDTPSHGSGGAARRDRDPAARGRGFPGERARPRLGRCQVHAASDGHPDPKLHLTGKRERVAKKTYIRASTYNGASFAQVYAKLRADPSWRCYEVPCGHDVMVDMPERLAEILEEVA